ncbi:MAG: DUF4105 domain-containing protein [Rhizobiaceae bacterium]|nr:DUF4105 domain-containing protein [Rhizobiaceae bacterium]
MRGFWRYVAIAIAAIVVLLLTAWGCLAFWYRLPLPLAGKLAAILFLALLGAAALLGLFTKWRWRASGLFAAAMAGILVWWGTIQPQAEGDWATDVSRQVTGEVEGNILTLTNVRNFNWRTRTDFDERWEVRRFDLNELSSLDMFLSYWAGPEMAHLLMSFGFKDGTYLAWSAEVKRSKGGAFSPVADFFKSSPLVIIAADERDIVRLRTNVRGEDVRLYRLNTSPENARKLLLEYVADANALAQSPQFYNSITTNCTTVIVKMMRAAGGSIPFDWRLIANGYLPGYAYDMGALDNRISLEEVKSRASIDEMAQAADTSPEFSDLIRKGVPSMHDK